MGDGCYTFTTPSRGARALGDVPAIGWLRGTAVERRSLAGELSPCLARDL